MEKLSLFSYPKTHLKGTIYVDFGDKIIGKNARMSSPANLKMYVPIKALTSSFILVKPASIFVERTMFPLVLAYAITSHKSQGGTYKHVVANLNKPHQVTSVMPGQVYTILSRLTSRQGLKLVNFIKDKIKVNNDALCKMESMRSTRQFEWLHPFPDEIGTIGHVNIRSLSAHHEDLHSDQNIQRLSILCLSETRLTVNSCNPVVIKNFDIFHKQGDHGVAICVKSGLPSSDVKCCKCIN